MAERVKIRQQMTKWKFRVYTEYLKGAESDKHFHKKVKKRERSYSFSQTWPTILQWENKLMWRVHRNWKVFTVGIIWQKTKVNDCNRRWDWENSKNQTLINWTMTAVENYQRIFLICCLCCSAIHYGGISPGRPQIMPKLLTMIVYSVWQRKTWNNMLVYFFLMGTILCHSIIFTGKDILM